MTTTILSPASDSRAQRQAMIDSQLRPSDVILPRLLRAMATVEREAFVPAERKAAAYSDRAIPLDGERSLNPPLTTARLIADLNPIVGSKLLLIGSATGYAAAVLSAMGVAVIAVESDPALAARHRQLMPEVMLVEGALTDGAAAYAPFDALLIDGAVERLPAALLAQLADRARVATGVKDGPVTRLARAVHVAPRTDIALLPFTDMDCVELPGFAAAHGFTF
jgi:protein-L-isoaspartate(D-aspartate) O-methyltransferase